MSRAWQSPLRYPGSKREAVYLLSPLVPREINRVVSPFFGGGSFELYLLASRGEISIVASDGFSPVINFWEHAVSKTDALVGEILSLWRDVSLERAAGWYQDLEAREAAGSVGGVRDAAVLYILLRMSLNSMLPLGFSEWQMRARPVMDAAPKALRAFGRRAALSRLSLACDDAFQVLARERDAFLFCDPPYLNDKNYYGFSSGRWHADFSHDNLADALRSHRGGFVLTYNDCPEIRSLYKWALVEPLVFSYGGGILGREVVIRPPGSPSIEEIQKARPPAVRWRRPLEDWAL